MNFEKALDLARELNKALLKINAEASDVLAGNNQAAAKLRVDRAVFDGKLKDLGEREELIKQTEGPIREGINARKIQSDNKDRAKAVEKAESDLKDARNLFAKEVAKIKQDLSIQLEEVKRQRDSYKTLKAELEAERANLKDSILNEIKSRL